MTCLAVIAAVLVVGCSAQHDSASTNSSPPTGAQPIVPSPSAVLPSRRVETVLAQPIDSDISDVSLSERHRVVRADDTSIVISREGYYGRDMRFKLFLDPGSRKLIKQVDLPPDAGLDSIPHHEAAAALGLPESVVLALKERDPRPPSEGALDAHLPRALRDHPMPSSSYADFARARPERVEDGYGPESEIGEMPGPLQMDGPRIWFGKTFYDGEGSSGVGGVGYFDTVESTFTFLKIPELAAWSVSSLLLDDQTLWIGLVRHPEGTDYGGGLLRHDLKTGATKKYPVDEVILRMKRWNGRTYLATTNGASVIEGDRLMARYLVEPDLNGKLVVVRFNP